MVELVTQIIAAVGELGNHTANFVSEVDGFLINEKFFECEGHF